jgi:hypothetical protein
VVFKIKEISSIVATGNGYSEKSMELSDAMEKAINWLANKPVATKVIVVETTTIERTE